MVLVLWTDSLGKQEGEDVGYTSLEGSVVDAVDDWVHATAHEHHDDGEVVEVAREVTVRVAEIVHQIIHLYKSKIGLRRKFRAIHFNHAEIMLAESGYHP